MNRSWKTPGAGVQRARALQSAGVSDLQINDAGKVELTCFIIWL